MKTFLLSILEDHSGGVSSNRVILCLWMLLLCGMWAYQAIGAPSLPDIPTGVLTLTGMLLSAKVVQRFAEKPEDPPASPPPAV